MSSPVYNSGYGDYVAREHWKINLKTVEDFVPADTLAMKVAALPLDNLSDKEQKAVKAFQKAIQRRGEGKSDDNWRDDDEE